MTQSENNPKLNKSEIAELIKEHLKAANPECRWCFAIDMERVEGKVIARYDFPDAMLLHLSCPRCGGEFTQYLEVWEGKYVTNMIHKLHPDSADIEDRLYQEANLRVFPEYLSDHVEV